MMRGENTQHSTRPNSNTEVGFTVMEILFVLAIAGILIALAIPSFANFVEREKIASMSDEFVSAVYVVRSAAIKSGVPVVLCASSDGKSCGSEWSDGWLSFRDDDRNTAPGVDEKVVLRKSNISNSTQLSVKTLNGESISAVRFNYRGAPDSALVISITLGDQDHFITVTPFGKPRHNE